MKIRLFLIHGKSWYQRLLRRNHSNDKADERRARPILHVSLGPAIVATRCFDYNAR
jgi:hypothetical protein